MDNKARFKAIKLICQGLEEVKIDSDMDYDIDLLYEIYDEANTLSMIVLDAIRAAKSNHADIGEYDQI